MSLAASPSPLRWRFLLSHYKEGNSTSSRSLPAIPLPLSTSSLEVSKAIVQSGRTTWRILRRTSFPSAEVSTTFIIVTAVLHFPPVIRSHSSTEGCASIHSVTSPTRSGSLDLKLLSLRHCATPPRRSNAAAATKAEGGLVRATAALAIPPGVSCHSGRRVVRGTRGCAVRRAAGHVRGVPRGAGRVVRPRRARDFLRVGRSQAPRQVSCAVHTPGRHPVPRSPSRRTTLRLLLARRR
ncbi:uncharacterized protein [Zea mays]|uniref:Uncharacterized protein n=1 Tax=Zea mays TaxID=4577 RepID=C0P3F3_MAIZE|nr:uncharacterized protein LOC100280017 [Zea mays]XP_035815435.1 uncharacterized protein LOC100280017 isoform X4 [Zea mays]ACN27519.1 unknown [Zea mays]